MLTLVKVVFGEFKFLDYFIRHLLFLLKVLNVN